MTARMTIGPVGHDIPLAVPSSGRWRGDQLTVDLSTAAADLDGDNPAAVARVLRDQIHGLTDLAGTVQPVTFEGTPELDGWYRLGAPDLTTDQASFADGDFDGSIDLDRVTRSANVLQELAMLGAGRANAHGLTTQRRGWWSPGVDAYGVDDGTGSAAAPTRAIRTGSEGSMLVVVDNPSGLSLFTGKGRWRVAPGDAHRGSCRILRRVDGQLYRVVGSQIPADAATGWGVSNTLIAVTNSGDNTPGCDIRWHDGAAWGPPLSIRITSGSGWADVDWPAVTPQVIRNTVDAAALRIFYGGLNAGLEIGWLDVAVRRGARHAEFRWNVPGGLADSWGIAQNPDSGADTHTSGIHQDPAAVDGTKWVFTTPVALTADVGDGRIRSTSTATTRWPFMVAQEPAAAVAGIDQFPDLVYQYMGASFTRQRCVIG